MSIKVDKKVLKSTPEEFKALPEGTYRLEKIESKRRVSMVAPGQFVEGELSIVSVQDKPCVRVQSNRSFWDYIRTSAIVEVTDRCEEVTQFETIGGHYRLTLLKRGKHE